MKNSKLMGVILVSLSLLTFSASRASASSRENERNMGRSAENFWSKRDDDGRGRSDNDHRRNDEGNGGKGGDKNGAVCLPINGQAWFLLVAGLGIGGFVILDKTKALRQQIHV